MSTQISTDLERLRTWLGEHPYGSASHVFDDGRRERDDVLRCFAIELSVSVRFALDDKPRSDAGKLQWIADAHARYERNCAEAKALFGEWMNGTKEEQ